MPLLILLIIISAPAIADSIPDGDELTEAVPYCANCVESATHASEAERSGITPELIAHIEETAKPSAPPNIRPASYSRDSNDELNEERRSRHEPSKTGPTSSSDFSTLLNLGVQGLGMGLQYSLGRQQIDANAALGWPTMPGGMWGYSSYGMGSMYGMGGYGMMGLYGMGGYNMMNMYGLGGYGMMGMYGMGNYGSMGLSGLRSTGTPGYYY